ncbi:methyltransferase FkbM family protein [Candidatus Termititenax aidoneus]|uniref:Methyltransferase FkbM family protein n=1 Tax=Termititenax aidoneus TaxID=2218524 RepID=A0A388TBU4_TERA1|nr:methyltransferase FkbM family protein [Candidatus Termititenax aidoneus]
MTTYFIFRVLRKICKAIYFTPPPPPPPHNSEKTLKATWQKVEHEHFAAFKKSSIVQNLNRDSVCIDCGANVGVITKLFADKGAAVYSFEPDSRCFGVLQKKFAKSPKVKLYKYGVLDRQDKLRLYKFKYHAADELFFSQGNSLYPTNTEIDKTVFEEIECIDIVEFIMKLKAPEIAVLKMDIEGSEFCVLDKLIDSGLYRRIKHILVEAHDKEIPELKELAQKVRKKIMENKIMNIDLSWV